MGVKYDIRPVVLQGKAAIETTEIEWGAVVTGGAQERMNAAEDVGEQRAEVSTRTRSRCWGKDHFWRMRPLRKGSQNCQLRDSVGVSVALLT